MRTDIEYARTCDRDDPLASFRAQFLFPQTPETAQEVIYLCGNSLGLQPKNARAAIERQLDNWHHLAVKGHFQGDTPWMNFQDSLARSYAAIVGARPVEIAAMNTLSVNLHLMMVSFYRPTKTRYKIMIEGGAFPSDQYAVKSQLAFHGIDPADGLIELTPRPGEKLLRPDDILARIATEGEALALVMLGGVNYYTGQLYDMQAITAAAHKEGALAGFDLAHAAGNVSLALHDWDVDFACWCSYKYLNSGPGSIAACFVHERHGNNPALPRFSGWYGHDKQSRFKMGPDFVPMAGAEGWVLSNPPILSMAAVRAALDLFDEAGMEAIRAKSLALTGYLEFLLGSLNSDDFTILTPRDPAARGAQLSLICHGDGRAVFDGLLASGVICDWREPDCIRIAPAPLYNSFTDIYNFVQIFTQQLSRTQQAQRA